MSILLGQIAPNFEQQTTIGPIRFHDWLGGAWGMLFSHPKNFTPVSTTELGEVARLQPEWARRNVKPISLGVDGVEAHRRWADDIRQTQSHTLDFPMIADADGRIARLYDMIHPDTDATLTVRSAFVIDQLKTVRLILTYPPSVGRNFQEILRAIDSLQLTDGQTVTTPVGWMPGDRVVIPPAVSDAAARAKYPQGFETLQPYLRLVQL